MPNPDFYREEFDRIARNGVIGDPHGQAAYAYLRVSSKGQAEEGRSGLPRQIEHCHEIAAAKGYRITWDMLFADDSTGFEFDDRQQLTALRNEFKSSQRRGQAVIMEQIHRLSRDARWHQGYLLDEMEKQGITPVFWRDYSSEIERAVMGISAQVSMEDSKMMMAEGTRRKARDGRITAKKRAYGWNFVDREGKILEKPGKWTYYAHNPDEQPIVLRIFKIVAAGGKAGTLAEKLNREGVPPPRKMSYWTQDMVCSIIKNPLYRGEFIAGRVKIYRERYIDEFGQVKTRTRTEKQPESNWIIVPVTPVVDPALWQLANGMLETNKQTARRNAGEPFLLTGLVKCACCGRSMHGLNRTQKQEGHVYHPRFYRCNSHQGMTTRRSKIKCPNGFIICHRLDTAVWSIVYSFLTQPEKYASLLDETFANDHNQSLLSQITYLDKQIASVPHQDEKYVRAYLADAFNEHELRDKRQALKAQEFA